MADSAELIRAGPGLQTETNVKPFDPPSADGNGQAAAETDVKLRIQAEAVTTQAEPPAPAQQATSSAPWALPGGAPLWTAATMKRWTGPFAVVITMVLVAAVAGLAVGLGVARSSAPAPAAAAQIPNNAIVAYEAPMTIAVTISAANCADVFASPEVRLFQALSSVLAP